MKRPCDIFGPVGMLPDEVHTQSIFLHNKNETRRQRNLSGGEAKLCKSGRMEAARLRACLCERRVAARARLFPHSAGPHVLSGNQRAFGFFTLETAWAPSSPLPLVHLWRWCPLNAFTRRRATGESKTRAEHRLLNTWRRRYPEGTRTKLSRRERCGERASEVTLLS